MHAYKRCNSLTPCQLLTRREKFVEFGGPSGGNGGRGGNVWAVVDPDANSLFSFRGQVCVRLLVQYEVGGNISIKNIQQKQCISESHLQLPKSVH